MNDGGPAFPVSTGEYFEGQYGMSLRDVFAGLAMMQILACQEGSVVYDDLAHDSYMLADCMIKHGRETTDESDS